MFFSKTLFVLFVCLVGQISAQNCIGYYSTNLCIECDLNSYLSNGLWSNDFINSTQDCSLKSSSDLYYNSTFFVSNITCSSSLTCLGTKQNPFDSLISAMIYIHNVDFAQKHREQNITIFLLGSPHYILNSDLNNSQNMRFFRRMNASIKIQPWFCEDENLIGCVSRQNIENINLIIKTHGFIFEIYRNFTMMNINLIGSDIVLNPATSKVCYDSNSLCCTDNLLDMSSSVEECGLYQRTINLNDISVLTQLKGLFHLRLLYEEYLTENPPIPILNLINLNFYGFFSIDPAGWLSLINFGTLGYDINIQNVILERSFFSYGFFYYSVLAEDPYYTFLNINQRINLYILYATSNVSYSSIKIDGLIIEKYNEYNFGITAGYSGAFVCNFFYLYFEINQNYYYYINNLQIKNINLAFSWNIFNITSNNYIYTLNNSIILNTYNLRLGIFVGANIIIEKTNFNMIFCYLMIAQLIGSIKFNECIFSYQIMFSSVFLAAISVEITFLNSLFFHIQEHSFLMKNGNLNLFSCKFVQNSISINYFLFGTYDIVLVLNDVHFLDSSLVGSVGFFTIFNIMSFSNPNIISINNSSFENILLPTITYFFYFESYNFQSSFSLNNFTFVNSQSYPITDATLHILYIFDGYFFDSVEINDCLLKNLTGSFFFFGVIDYKKMIFNNIIVSDVVYMAYYFIYLGHKSIVPNAIFSMTNVLLRNLTMDMSEILITVTVPDLFLQNIYLVNLKLNQKYPTYIFDLYSPDQASNVFCDSVLLEGTGSPLVSLMAELKFFNNTVISNINFICISKYMCNSQVLYIEQINYVTIINLTCINQLLTNTNVNFGIIWLDNVINITLLGSIFSNNSVNQLAVLVCENINYINIINNTFINSSSNDINGGAMKFILTNFVYIEKIYNLQSFSYQDGGVITFYEVTELIIINSSFMNARAYQNGGTLFINTVSTGVYLKDIIINNSSANNYGGSFCFFNVKLVEIENLLILNTSAFSGGAIYIDSCDLTVNNIVISDSAANLGGGFYIKGDFTNLLHIQNANFNYCSAITKGSILYISSIKALNIIQSNFSNNFVENIGGIYLDIYNDNILDFNDTMLYNCSFLESNFYNNSGQAAIIYSSSNYLIFIKNMTIEEIEGSIFYIQSDSTTFIDISSISIIKCNSFVKSELISLTTSLLVFHQININITNLNFEQSLNKMDLIEIDNCNVFINNSNFSDFVKTPESNRRVFFLLKKSYFNFLNSNVFYQDLNGNHNIFFNLSNSTIYLMNSTFFYAKLSDSAIVNTIESTVYLDSCLFYELSSYIGIFFLQDTNLTIIKSNFSLNINLQAENTNDDSTSLIRYINQLIVPTRPNQILIQNSVFKNTGTNSILIRKVFNVSIESSIFISESLKNINKSSFSRALYIDDCTNVAILSTFFINFGSEIGGALSLYQINSEDEMYVFINNCSFNNNLGYIAGAMNILGSIFLNINDSKFLNNRALMNNNSDDYGKGGCMIIDCEFYLNCRIQMNNSEFKENFAEKYGPTLLMKSKSYSLENNLFINNFDNLNFTDSILSLPLKQQLLSSDFNQQEFYDIHTNLSNFELTKTIIDDYASEFLIVSSGQNFNFSLLLMDAFNQTLITDSGSIATLTCDSVNQSVLIEKPMSKSVNGIISFINSQITWYQNIILNCTITLFIEDSTFFKSTEIIGESQTIQSLDYYFNIKIRNCQKGEILMGDLSCRICSAGTFSLKDPMNSNSTIECTDCPSNANCFGGSSLYPKYGNWRKSENSSLIIACSSEEACIGSDPINDLNFTEQELISGKCSENYYGNICYLCQPGFARSNTNENCEKCSNMIWIYVKTALGFIFIILYTFVQASIYSSLRNDDPNLAILLKLLLNHFQIIAMVSLIDLGWTVDFNYYFGVQQYLSFIYQDFFEIDCLIQNINQNLFLQKTIFTMLLPIIFFLILLILWIISFLRIIYKNHKKSLNSNEKNSFLLTSKMRITFLTLIFIFYPEILRKCFMLVNCLTLDDSDSFRVLKFSPDIQCWGSEHILWSLTVAIPGIVIWGIVTPIIIFYVLYKHRLHIFSLMAQKNEVKKTNKTKILKQNIIIDIEECIAEKLFENYDFPLKNGLSFKKKNLVFYQVLQANVKSKNDILEELGVQNTENPQELNELLQEFYKENTRNEVRLIKDINEFYEIFSFLDLDKNILKQNDLDNGLVHIKISYENTAKMKFNHSISIFGKKKSTFKENQTADETLEFKNLGFIFKGFKKDYYFWEIVLFSRKFLLIMIGAFSEFFPNKTKDINLLFILISYFILHVNCKPYQYNYLNRIENISLFIATLTAQIGMILYSETMQKGSIFFLCVVFFINFYYFGYWIYCLHKFGKIKEKILNFMQNLKKRK